MEASDDLVSEVYGRTCKEITKSRDQKSHDEIQESEVKSRNPRQNPEIRGEIQKSEAKSRNPRRNPEIQIEI